MVSHEGMTRRLKKTEETLVENQPFKEDCSIPHENNIEINLDLDDSLSENASSKAEGNEPVVIRVPSRAIKGIPPVRLIETCNIAFVEPTSYQEAMNCPEKKELETAMEKELNSSTPTKYES